MKLLNGIQHNRVHIAIGKDRVCEWNSSPKTFGSLTQEEAITYRAQSYMGRRFIEVRDGKAYATDLKGNEVRVVCQSLEEDGIYRISELMR